MQVSFQNFRAYAQGSPAEFELSTGFTAFVGRNNAGKSTCLRAIFELRQLFQRRDLWLGADLKPKDFEVTGEPDRTILLNYNNLEPALISIDIGDSPKASDAQRVLVKAIVELRRDGRVAFHTFFLQGSRDRLAFRPPFQPTATLQQGTSSIYRVVDSEGNQHHFSAEAFQQALQKLSESVYFGPYRNAINEGGAKHYDIAVGTTLIQQWDYWKAGPNRANQRAIAKVEADIQRLLGFSSVEINASSDNKTLNVSINKHPFKLADLGAGVAELVMTLSSALIAAPTYILIDEPESHLHPSLQVDFLTTLAGYATEGILFSSHSIGLARSVADRIYAIVHSDAGATCKKYEKQPHLAELLGSLSYAGYFPAENAFILLVEGSSEVKTFQALLRKLKLNHLYAILPLGGTQLIRENSDSELAEVVRIAGSAKNVFAVVDSERSSPAEALSPDRAGFAKTCANLGIRCHLTEKRATENYFSQEAIQAAFGNSFHALGPHDRLKDIAQGWPKSSNWKIADHEDGSFFSRHDLGKFLSSLQV